MEMYQAGRDHILKATRRVDANLYVKTELKNLIYFALITEEVQPASRCCINHSLPPPKYDQSHIARILHVYIF